MCNPKITVVVPLFNKQQSVSRCLNSIVGQTKPADQIIVVDDGSTDESAAIVSSQFGAQVDLVQQPNGGVSSARNTGLNQAKYQYVAFLDADDEWHPEFLEEIHQLIHTFPTASLYGTAYVFMRDQTYIRPRLHVKKHEHRLLLANYFKRIAKHDLLFNASSVCLNKRFTERYGNFPIGEPMGEDQDLWNRAALHGSIAYSTKSLATYHLAAENRACQACVPKQECNFSKRLAIAATRSQPGLARSLRQCCANHLLDLVRRNFMAGDIRTVKTLLRDPRARLHPLRWGFWSVRLLWARLQNQPG